MFNYIYLLILLPTLTWIISLFLPKQKESIISQFAFFLVGLHMIFSIIFIITWALSGFKTIDTLEISLYRNADYNFFLDFSFDNITAVYLLVGSIITFLITLYCKYYMHREDGYKRFFNSILLSYTSYNFVIFSGNLETLFIGWEALGISSFLLIAFYRNRYLPVKNAVKVFSIYRIGDIGLILAIWLNHHLWHQNINFMHFNSFSPSVVQQHAQSISGILVSFFIILAASAKSAQLPFSSWLPRAMEGPTPSSAIFYGSLSVHLGVFLLLRTFPFWENQPVIRFFIFLLGLLTSIFSNMIARTQSSVKSQIAYSSITQIGLIFIELSLGFNLLALFHLAGNAFLRTYQLLVSPSVVSYLIRNQFYHFTPKQGFFYRYFSRKIVYSVYVICLKELNLGLFMNTIYWRPLKYLSHFFDFLSVKNLISMSFS